MTSRLVMWPLLFAKTSFSAGLVLMGIALLPVIALVGIPLTGLAATFFFLPALPFLTVFNYSHLVHIPLHFLPAILVLFIPAGVTFNETNINGWQSFVRQVATCLFLVGLLAFAIFCGIYFQYGTAFALNSPERERVVMSFVPTGAVGIVLLLESALLGYVAKRMEKVTVQTG